MDQRTVDEAIRQDRFVKEFLERLPEEVANRFDDQQLSHIKAVFGTRSWGTHSIDWRGTFFIPMRRKRYYYVVLFGKNRRHLTHTERQASLLMTAVLILGLTLFVVLGLYLLKSALGIDVLPNFSFGVWNWFKANFQ